MPRAAGMSGFPTVNFGQPEGGLFTPAEIGRLMESEVQRAARYAYPLAVLVVEIDRLESLHDLYGVDSEARILRAVTSLLRSSTRASDALGVLRDRRLLILLPHATREAAAVVARRLLAGCRELEFRGDGRNLRASLSIGLAQCAGEAELGPLCARAERALVHALEAGGDRAQEAERLPEAAPAPARADTLEVPPAVPARRKAPARAELPSLAELAGGTLEEKVKLLLRLAGGSGDLGRLEQEVLGVLQRTVNEARRPRATRAEVQAEIRTLEERVAELKRLLGASEEELARMVREKSLDPGVASIYRSVQGLDPAEDNYQKKKELLAVLYRANVDLLRELQGELGAGG